MLGPMRIKYVMMTDILKVLGCVLFSRGRISWARPRCSCCPRCTSQFLLRSSLSSLGARPTPLRREHPHLHRFLRVLYAQKSPWFARHWSSSINLINRQVALNRSLILAPVIRTRMNLLENDYIFLRLSRRNVVRKNYCL